MNRKPVEEFLKPQGRFKHLFTPENAELLASVQAEVDRYWEYIQKRSDLRSVASAAVLRVPKFAGPEGSCFGARRVIQSLRTRSLELGSRTAARACAQVRGREKGLARPLGRAIAMTRKSFFGSHLYSQIVVPLIVASVGLSTWPHRSLRVYFLQDLTGKWVTQVADATTSGVVARYWAVQRRDARRRRGRRRGRGSAGSLRRSGDRAALASELASRTGSASLGGSVAVIDRTGVVLASAGKQAPVPGKPLPGLPAPGSSAPSFTEVAVTTRPTAPSFSPPSRSTRRGRCEYRGCHRPIDDALHGAVWPRAPTAAFCFYSASGEPRRVLPLAGQLPRSSANRIGQALRKPGAVVHSALAAGWPPRRCRPSDACGRSRQVPRRRAQGHEPGLDWDIRWLHCWLCEPGSVRPGGEDQHEPHRGVVDARGRGARRAGLLGCSASQRPARRNWPTARGASPTAISRPRSACHGEQRDRACSATTFNDMTDSLQERSRVADQEGARARDALRDEPSARLDAGHGRAARLDARLGAAHLRPRRRLRGAARPDVGCA